MDIVLRDLKLPELEFPDDLPVIPGRVYEERCNKFYEAVNCDWLMVYGDREHFANIQYLSGYDPRFEEAILLIGPKDAKYLLVGNEGLDYTSEMKIKAEVVLYQPFSLMGQDRSKSPRLDDILKDIGLKREHQAGICGWKYMNSDENVTDSSNMFVPAIIVECVNSLTDRFPMDVTSVLMHPKTGLRAYNEIEQIALSEFGALKASLAVHNIMGGLELGMTEFKAVSNMNYMGEPLSAHVMFSASEDKIVGLSSPSSNKISEGDGVTTAVGYWGGLSSRAGLVTNYNEDFLEKYAKPYYCGIATWYQEAKIGVKGGDLFSKVTSELSRNSLRSALNPGHLTSMDEWLHSPVRSGSDDVLASGMAMQCDIIPAPLQAGFAINCEDTVVFADDNLRKQLAEYYPKVWERIRKKQKFIRTEIGLNISDDLLPLSYNSAYFNPFWLSLNKVLTLG